MKIAHYASSISHSAGGLYYSVSGLAKAQKQAGIDVLVVGGADTHFEADKHQWGDVDLFPHKLGHRYGFSSNVITKLLQFKPDILHVHGLWSAASVYALFASAMRTPVVIAPRGMLDPWILGQNQVAKRLHGAVIERPVLRRVHVHALNELERAAVGQYMPQALPRTFVVPNGVDTRIASSLQQAHQRSGALYLGRLHPKKQVIELVTRWGEAEGLRDISLTVAGWGDPQYEAELVQSVNRFGNVRFVGPLYGVPKEELLTSSRYFVLPSLSEGLPMSVLEALSFGTIPVITAQCNLPELISNNVAFPISSNLDDLASAIVSLAGRSTAELDAVAEAGMKYSQRYQWSSIAQQMQAHYEDLLGS